MGLVTKIRFYSEKKNGEEYSVQRREILGRHAFYTWVEISPALFMPASNHKIWLNICSPIPGKLHVLHGKLLQLGTRLCKPFGLPILKKHVLVKTALS